MGNYFSNGVQFPLQTRTHSRYGWVRDIPNHNDIFRIVDRSSVSKLPDKFGLCNEFMPDVYDQGHLGSCTANAIMGSFCYDHNKQFPSAKFNGSRLFLYYNERVIEGTIDRDSGASIRDGIEVTNKIGVCPEIDFPYDIRYFTNEPSKAAYEDAKKHRNVTYERIGIDPVDFKIAINSGNPVIFGFSVPKSFEGSEMASTGIMKMPGLFDSIVGGHAVVAVGYDDNMTADGQTGFMLVRNSWGSSWGSSGYFYMPYKFIVDKNCADAWVINLVQDFEKVQNQNQDQPKVQNQGSNQVQNQDQNIDKVYTENLGGTYSDEPKTPANTPVTPVIDVINKKADLNLNDKSFKFRKDSSSE
jgi:C1A family cysteine protease